MRARSRGTSRALLRRIDRLREAVEQLTTSADLPATVGPVRYTEPEVVEVAARCPECRSTDVSFDGVMYTCNACGTQFMITAEETDEYGKHSSRYESIRARRLALKEDSDDLDEEEDDSLREAKYKWVIRKGKRTKVRITTGAERAKRSRAAKKAARKSKAKRARAARSPAAKRARAKSMKKRKSLMGSVLDRSRLHDEEESSRAPLRSWAARRRALRLKEEKRSSRALLRSRSLRRRAAREI